MSDDGATVCTNCGDPIKDFPTGALCLACHHARTFPAAGPLGIPVSDAGAMGEVYDNLDRYDQWARSPIGVAYLERVARLRCITVCSAHRERQAGCSRCHAVVDPGPEASDPYGEIDRLRAAVVPAAAGEGAR
jgi:hypothetical protein